MERTVGPGVPPSPGILANQVRSIKAYRRKVRP